jgi:hypothetical protein
MLELLLVLILVGVVLALVERTRVVDPSVLWAMRVIVLVIVAIYLVRALGLDTPLPRLR